MSEGDHARASPIDVDVLIVGSGPAGISTALHLVAKDPAWAERILVIDKHVHPRPKLCGGGITGFGLAALDQLGLSLPTNSFSIRELAFSYEDLTYSVFGDPILNIVDRAEFDFWLVERALAKGVSIRQGECLTDITVNDSHVTATTEAGTIRAQCVVGADGSRGAVRRLLDWDDSSDRSGAKLARVIEIETPERSPETLRHRERQALFNFTGMSDGVQGYDWEFPSLANGVPVMSRGVFDSRVLPSRATASLKGRLRAAAQAASHNLDDYPIKGHPIRGYHPRGQICQHRVLAVGDAAGVDPLLGEGISMALAYGEVAAEAVNDAFRRTDFTFSTYRRRIHRNWLLWQLPWRARLARAAYADRSSRFLRAGWRLAGVSLNLAQGGSRQLPVRGLHLLGPGSRSGSATSRQRRRPVGPKI